MRQTSASDVQQPGWEHSMTAEVTNVQSHRLYKHYPACCISRATEVWLYRKHHQAVFTMYPIRSQFLQCTHMYPTLHAANAIRGSLSGCYKHTHLDICHDQLRTAMLHCLMLPAPFLTIASRCKAAVQDTCVSGVHQYLLIVVLLCAILLLAPDFCCYRQM